MASFGDYNRVNTNVTAMDAQLSLNKINKDLGESRLRLSTGFKINSAGDDAAGFAIATKLKSRVAGLEQALQNVSDVKSMLNMVDASYNSVMDNLIEMKSLSTQASNDTLSQSERTYIATQIHALGENINDIARSTTFNSVNLLPAAEVDLVFQVGEGVNDTMEIKFNDIDMLALFSDGAADADIDGDGDIEIKVGAVGDTATLSGANTDNDDRGEIDFLIAGTAAGEGTDTEVDATGADFRSFTTSVDTAISRLSGFMNQLGIDQNSLSTKEINLTEAITANSAARSRIMDTDFAKEQSNSIRLQILQQTATAALSQANMGPQAVLGFLG